MLNIMYIDYSFHYGCMNNTNSKGTLHVLSGGNVLFHNKL